MASSTRRYVNGRLHPDNVITPEPFYVGGRSTNANVEKDFIERMNEELLEESNWLRQQELMRAQVRVLVEQEYREKKLALEERKVKALEQLVTIMMYAPGGPGEQEAKEHFEQNNL